MAKRENEERGEEEPDTGSDAPDDAVEEDGDAPVDHQKAARRDALTKRQLEDRRRLSTIFGWVAGAALGLLINFALFRLVGDGYPTTITTFGFVIAGAFGGMTVSDRLGPKGFKPLGIAAGVLLALILAVVAAFFMSPPTS
ncbi:MAG: hypothetical protein AB8I08_35840 [Sandaracinaceae bacterium]